MKNKRKPTCLRKFRFETFPLGSPLMRSLFPTAAVKCTAHALLGTVGGARTVDSYYALQSCR